MPQPVMLKKLKFTRTKPALTQALSHLTHESLTYEQVLSNQPALYMVFYTHWTLNKHFY